MLFVNWNVFDYGLNAAIKENTTENSLLRNRFVQTVLVFFIIIFVAVCYYYFSGEYKNPIQGPTPQSSLDTPSDKKNSE
jgi:hypothetical protein